MPASHRLTIDIAPGECVRLSGAIEQAEIELVHKSGRVARLRITAPDDVRIEKARQNMDLAELPPSMARFIPTA